MAFTVHRKLPFDRSHRRSVCIPEVIILHIISLPPVLASEVGSYGITVNAYAPGPIDTPLRTFMLCSPLPCYLPSITHFLYFICTMILTCTHPVQSSADALAQLLGVPDGKPLIREVRISLSLPLSEAPGP